MLEEMNIYWIGGSPCSGKSTISEMLVNEFGFEMYKCDDYLDQYTEIGFENGVEIMKKIKSMSLDETWLRDVEEQVMDEFEYYRQALTTIVSDLEKSYKGKRVLVEGAAILPEFIRSNGIDFRNFICIVPTKEFQVNKYRQREWVSSYLQGCSDMKKAFENWMERDARYAQIVKADAENNGMNVIVVDGYKSIDDTYLIVKQLFGLIP